MKRFTLTPKSGSHTAPNTPWLLTTEDDDGEWVRHIDAWHVVTQNKLLLARKQELVEIITRMENEMIGINDLIFCNGAPTGSSAYFHIREIAARYAREKHELEKG